jgi:hypothetical protein
MTQEKMTVDKMTIGKMAVDKMAVDKMVQHQLLVVNISFVEIQPYSRCQGCKTFFFITDAAAKKANALAPRKFFQANLIFASTY